MWKGMLLESCIALIQPIPMVSLDITVEQLGFVISYPVDVCLTMLMFMKSYLILRYAAHTNGMYNSLSKWISRSVAIEITPLFILPANSEKNATFGKTTTKKIGFLSAFEK